MVEQTWVNFKSHFETAHEVLKKIRGAEMQHTEYHQAYIISSHMKEELHQVQENVINELRNQDSLAITIDDQNVTAPPEPSPNSVTHEINNTTNAALLDLIKALTEQVAELKNTSTRSKKQVPKHYCWSHGKCNHKGVDCRAKKANHKDEATLNNRMGGSNKGCGSE